MEEVVTEVLAGDDVAEECAERGASLVEYALLLALIAVVCVVAVTTLGSTVSESVRSSGSSMFDR